VSGSVQRWYFKDRHVAVCTCLAAEYAVCTQPETIPLSNKSMSCLNEIQGVTQQMKKFPPFMEPEGLLLCSQEHVLLCKKDPQIPHIKDNKLPC
jgi:hypothetical protein